MFGNARTAGLDRTRTRAQARRLAPHLVAGGNSISLNHASQYSKPLIAALQESDSGGNSTHPPPAVVTATVSIVARLLGPATLLVGGWPSLCDGRAGRRTGPRSHPAALGHHRFSTGKCDHLDRPLTSNGRQLPSADAGHRAVGYETMASDAAGPSNQPDARRAGETDAAARLAIDTPTVAWCHNGAKARRARSSVGVVRGFCFRAAGTLP